MRAFSYLRVGRVEDALAAAGEPHTKLLAGGTNLLDLMKGDIEQPNRIVDIRHLPLDAIEKLPEGGIRIRARLGRRECRAAHGARRLHERCAAGATRAASCPLAIRACATKPEAFTSSTKWSR